MSYLLAGGPDSGSVVCLFIVITIFAFSAVYFYRVDSAEKRVLLRCLNSKIEFTNSPMWLAGTGVKDGQAIGSTDEFGFGAVEDPVHVSDLHATILHIMGLDHNKLTYFYQGLDQKLTGVDRQAKVVEKALA